MINSLIIYSYFIAFKNIKQYLDEVISRSQKSAADYCYRYNFKYQL
jgi:hypothetical protein